MKPAVRDPPPYLGITEAEGAQPLDREHGVLPPRDSCDFEIDVGHATARRGDKRFVRMTIWNVWHPKGGEEDPRRMRTRGAWSETKRWRPAGDPLPSLNPAGVAAPARWQAGRRRAGGYFKKPS